ncbi:hypothetical protein [Rossellomorea marisflavi]|uniref:hypothetical protein n=1 Tax=Rossellomorea marisflavi TaxID=189381 RepID=UPI003FA0B32E
MFSALVLIIIVFGSAFGLFLLLGRLGLFKTVGNAVKDVKEDIHEKNSDTPKKQNKGSDV